MGTIDLLGLALTAATTTAQVVQARKSVKAQKEAGRISSANQQIQDRAARRAAMRDSRIRQAMIENSAVGSGASGSSGEIGATGALGSNTGAAIANQSSQQIAANAIGKQNVKSAQAQTAFDTIGQIGKTAGAGLDLWEEYKKPLGSE